MLEKVSREDWPWGQVTKVSLTKRNQNFGLRCQEFMARVSKFSMKYRWPQEIRKTPWKCVTPYFPQFVNITILAKNCGKPKNVNVWCEWTLWKRSMNVNNIMNIYCRTVERGYVEKETVMAGERRWKAPRMVALTSTKTNTVFGLHWPGEPRASRWLRIKWLVRIGR